MVFYEFFFGTSTLCFTKIYRPGWFTEFFVTAWLCPAPRIGPQRKELDSFPAGGKDVCGQEPQGTSGNLRELQKKPGKRMQKESMAYLWHILGVRSYTSDFLGMFVEAFSCWCSWTTKKWNPWEGLSRPIWKCSVRLQLNTVFLFLSLHVEFP